MVKIIRLLLFPLGAVSLAVIFAFAISNPNIVNGWIMWVLAGILALNLTFCTLDTMKEFDD